MLFPSRTKYRKQQRGGEVRGTAHKGENIEVRISRYSALGWACLIIWEHELEEGVNLVAKLKRFS